ncbi:uncharacterized protein LOC133034815 [Cannabis sativa]|uniref:uncharacterized protein LOC133034815 n=1 Tax=Cannabis sativa TaxID=3483 RepID=UPI0029CA411A|nr:uncharacterized protein LOC133034815 [Cannabis sativa]
MSNSVRLLPAHNGAGKSFPNFGGNVNRPRENLGGNKTRGPVDRPEAPPPACCCHFWTASVEDACQPKLDEGAPRSASFEVALTSSLRGIQPSYNPWYFHGRLSLGPQLELPENDEEEMADVLADMLRGDHGFDESANTTDSFNEPPINDNNKFDDLFKEMEAELYPGCKKSALNALVKLMHCKVLNRWSNHSFDMLLSILIDLFPEGTKLPKSHYESKMRLRNLGLGYDSIDVCKYNCAIFWKENEKKEFCPVCGESRWVKRKGKGKKVPHKVMRYFPLTPRLKRLYCSRHTAEDMRWHYSQRPKEDGVLRHPADAEEWKQFDRLHPSFAVEPRNVRLGLATDGFNPFGNMSNSYSLWPVICVPYNLPPWKCMSSESLLLTLLIPGPSSPGKDIDVFMRPLIDELKQLWETGVETRDAYNGTVFSMRAAVLWTINDFPAYALMSGWSTKGYMACPTCNEHTLLSIDGKSKDTDKARMDLQDLQIRRELWLYEDRNGKWKKPPASYNRPDRNNDIVQNMPTRQFSVFKHVGRPIGMRTVDTLPMQSKRKAEWYILNNCTEVEPYINEHKELLQARGVGNIETVQETEFPEWFKTQINELRLTNQGAVSDELYAIANPANTAIYFYPGCIVNGIKFLVKERDDNRKTQNSGVMVPGEDGQNFYGTLEKIMEFTYLKDCSVLLFFCKWFDTNGSRMDSDGVITSICVNRQWYQNEPFILASQAKLIYYIPDLKNGKDWLIVNEYIPRNVWDFPDTDGETPFVQENNSTETEFVVQLPQLDDVDYVRHDVDPTEVANIHRVNSQPQQLDDFIVDDDNEGLNTEEDNSLELESDSDDNAVYVTDDEDDEL